jgi:hypothetical protein
VVSSATSASLALPLDTTRLVLSVLVAQQIVAHVQVPTPISASLALQVTSKLQPEHVLTYAQVLVIVQLAFVVTHHVSHVLELSILNV